MEGEAHPDFLKLTGRDHGSVDFHREKMGVMLFYPNLETKTVGGSAQRCLVKTQLRLWTSWLPMKGITWLFRTVGVLKRSALFTHCRYLLFTIRHHGQVFPWTWWKAQPWLPSLQVWERGEKLRAFWLRVKWRHEGSRLGAADTVCGKSVSNSRFSSSEQEASWCCSFAGGKR